tara:strand:+ start:6085 stop:7164 length:1080 start_codon:yes stop_codon:yes gene_type:complete
MSEGFRLINSRSQNDSLDTIPSDRLWLRSELMGTQVITRDTGRRLGLVGEVVVDIDRREVVALGLRDNPLTRFLPGLPRWMPLDRIRQVGDVILVDSVDSLSEGFTPERYSRVINCQVITESGQQLGRVLGFSFDIETGELTTLVMGALGVPLLGEGVLSTWEIPVEEIVSSGSDRIIVYEGAEDKLKQLNSGFLEKLGVGGSSWEEQERDRYRVNLVPVENQLSSGENNQELDENFQSDAVQDSQDEIELEYVELDNNKEGIMQKRRYLDDPSKDSFNNFDDYSEVQRGRYDLKSNESDVYSQEEKVNSASRSKSRRPYQRSEDPVDVEPLNLSPSLDEKTISQKSPKSDQNELEDPW